jgi:hypothetical protein
VTTSEGKSVIESWSQGRWTQSDGAPNRSGAPNAVRFPFFFSPMAIGGFGAINRPSHDINQYTKATSKHSIIV